MRYRLETVEDRVLGLDPDVIYLVGADDPWMIEMLCPCGCMDCICLNLLEDDFPAWRVWLSEEGEACLSPSIWRTVGCKSHFFIRNGEVRWALSSILSDEDPIVNNDEAKSTERLRRLWSQFWKRVRRFFT